MLSLVTSGWICLQDEYNFVYKIARIDYTEWEDGNFKYSFTPFYSVINLLPPRLFQGIPGIDLSLRRACYERENIVPIFISERTPSENREDLWQLLEESGMNALNRLEWLIRTNKRYPGDNFFVKPVTGRDVVEERPSSMYQLVDRYDKIVRKLLEIICFGDCLICDEIIINDDNRAEYYKLFMSMYVKDYHVKRAARLAGIDRAKANNLYRGRVRTQIDPLLFDNIATAYLNNEISVEEATAKLGISRSTFFRRLRDFK